ncbi:MAG: hypothetical protein OSJ70_00340 [Bacilli bacterium]|nr:hypothetical protein [Bacilli bacterium]
MHSNEIILMSDEIKKVITSKRASVDVEKFIFSHLENLEIEITNREAKKASLLVYEEKMAGWCYETTEAMSVFFEHAYLVRGYLNNHGRKYYHAWLEIFYDGELYVFDPALNILCPKKVYDTTFETYMKVSLSSNIIRESLIEVLEGKTPKYVPHFDKKTNEEVLKFGLFLESMQPDYGVSVPYSDDLLSPFYRNKSAYKGKIEDNKIKSLRVHFFDDEA